MPKNDIGGFFVSLGLNIDKNSWETGNRLIDGMGNSLNKLIGTARNTAVVLAGTAIATGKVESSLYKTSVALGVSTEKLDLWKASAKIAGVSADGIVSAMSQMANVMNHMTIDGSGLEAYTEQLGKLNILSQDVDIEQLLKLSPDELMQEILSKAQAAVAGGMDLRIASTIVGDILGESGQNFFIELERQGKTIDEFLAGAAKTLFNTEKNNQDSQEFMEQFRILKTTSENLSRLFGSEVASQLTEHLQSLNTWLGGHGTELKNGVKKLAEGIGKIVDGAADIASNEKVQDAAKKTGTAITGNVKTGAKGMYHVLHGAINGDWDEVLEGLAEQWSATGGTVIGGAKNALSANEQWKATQERINKYRKDNGISGNVDRTLLPLDLQADIRAQETKLKKFTGIKDGIIRPDGTVTQVAPDDWVFAARNIGDMARAFTPHNYTAASTNEYVINQTFNINGGSDMPQVLRQQAYRGTQEGLLEIMNQSSQRLQLMSGTR